MAIAGQRPKIPALDLVKGGKKGDKAPPPEILKRTDPLVPPKPLNKTQKGVWERWIEPAWWLDDGDVLLAYIFTCTMAEYLRSPVKMPAAKVGELRKSMAELHITSSERARIGVTRDSVDPAEKFFE